MPRDEKFFELFIADGENLLAAARELEAMVTTTTGSRSASTPSGTWSIRATRSTTSSSDRIERAFITPFDREDIHELAARLDDVVDGIQEVAETFLLYGIDTRRPRRPKALAGVLAGQAEHLLAALQHARGDEGPGGGPDGRSTSWRTRRTACPASAIAGLFRGQPDAVEIIKWRDIYTSLEETIDAAEDAGEIIERMVHKAT